MKTVRYIERFIKSRSIYEKLLKISSYTLIQQLLSNWAYWDPIGNDFSSLIMIWWHIEFIDYIKQDLFSKAEEHYALKHASYITSETRIFFLIFLPIRFQMLKLLAKNMKIQNCLRSNSLCLMATKINGRNFRNSFKSLIHNIDRILPIKKMH